ncbi:MAG: hypothetical protein K0U93_22125 [Gammaproteobacteria bacterium]|nr:hypothetical protein [Gammaproteobacteria bacterium]
MTLQLLDPTHETVVQAVNLAPRLATLANATVGFISNGKEGSKGFFHHLERFLKDEHGVGEIVYRVKSSYSAPADAPIMEEARTWDLAITGIGD